MPKHARKQRAAERRVRERRRTIAAEEREARGDEIEMGHIMTVLPDLEDDEGDPFPEDQEVEPLDADDDDPPLE